MTLWSKNGHHPRQLPDRERGYNDDGERVTFMPVEGNLEALQKGGWVEAPEQPAYDPIHYDIKWGGSDWELVEVAPEVLIIRQNIANQSRLVTFNNQVNARLQQAFLVGFPPSLPAFTGKRLQVRDVEDRTNWLTSKSAYMDAIQAGHGAVVGASFRTMDNVTVTVSFTDGYSVLVEMAQWGRSIMANSWALKDAYRAALEAGESTDGINIDAGWPVS